MKLITPHVEIWTQGEGIDNMWKHIARCTLVCRQAESFREGETAEEFCVRTILAKEPFNNEGNHLAMLEHGTVYLKIPKFRKFAYDYNHDKYSIVNSEIGSDYEYVTTNLRVLVEHNSLLDLKYFSKPTGYHAKRITACFTTNIGVTREFNRHRVNSIAEESTRYCNYSKDKFDNQVRFALPAWLLDEENLPYVESHQFDKLESYIEDIYGMGNTIVDNWSAIDFYLAALTFAEWSYNMLIAKGWNAQQAREVLPLATKSQLIHTAFEDDWKHFFKLRYEGVSGAPHPNAKLVAEKLYKQFNNG